MSIIASSRIKGFFALSVLALVALLILACGGDEEDAASATIAPTATVTQTATATPAANAAGPGACDVNTGQCTPDAQGDVSFPIGDNWYVHRKFTGLPGVTINAKVGQQVTVNVNHTAQVGHNLHVAGPDNRYEANLCTTDGPEPCTNPDTIRGGGTGVITFQFDQAGSFEFRCDFHPTSMKGIIQVTQ